MIFMGLLKSSPFVTVHTALRTCCAERKNV